MKSFSTLVILTLGALGGFLQAGCSAKATKPTPSVAAEPEALRIIDVHTHTKFTGKAHPESGIVVSEENFFAEMKENHVIGAIAHTGTNGENYFNLRDRNVIHCAGTGAKVDVARIERGLKSKQYGCIKIYLGYVPQYAYDKNYDPAYRLAEKYDVPVVFHTGDTYAPDAMLKYSDPMAVDEVSVRYPKVKFVIAHAGNPWIETAAELAYNKANIYLDLSAFLIGDLRETDPEKIETYVVKPIRWIFGYVENPKKLMFGTDWPLTRMKETIEAVKRAIPREHWGAVFHDNAVAVFKLAP